jgi:hypothetical protein
MLDDAVCPLRLWPQKKWKRIVLITFLALIAVGAILTAYVLLSINKDVVSPIVVINPGGVKTALIVYQPGLSSAPKDNSYTFAYGVNLSGWRVEITTASPEAPSDLSNYSLLVIAFPIYGGAPGTAAIRYVDRLGNLQGIHAVIIDVPASENIMRKKVEAKNGTVIETLVADGKTDIRQAGSQIAP